MKAVPALAAALLLISISRPTARACDLCAVYGADSAVAGANRGFTATFAEQYIYAHTLQAEGSPFTSVPFLSEAFLDSSYTRIVPSYNFSSRFSLSFNLPIIYRDFHRTELTTTGGVVDERGSLAGLGDTALIARYSIFQLLEMKRSINISILAGVKLPTGDTERLDEEVASAIQDEIIFGPNHAHGSIGGVHNHDLTLGSGSYDGIFGLTSSMRWKRLFLNGQFQYYLRTEARGYQFGDMIMVSGGPGGYVLLNRDFTLSLQANAFYESTARDQIIGQTFNQTGGTAWFLGPLLGLTWGLHFSANAGVDIPLHIYNHGLQTVPDYRFHGGITWRF
jgi:hypothetical protein